MWHFRRIAAHAKQVQKLRRVTRRALLRVKPSNALGLTTLKAELRSLVPKVRGARGSNGEMREAMKRKRVEVVGRKVRVVRREGLPEVRIVEHAAVSAGTI